MRTFLFDIPAGREEFLNRIQENGTIGDIELATNIELEHISNLNWKKIHRLSASPADIDTNIFDFRAILGSEKANIVTFNEGAMNSLPHLQKEFSPTDTWALSRLDNIRNKYHARYIMEKAGIPVPEYHLATNSELPAELKFKNGQKWIAKPNFGMGGRSVRLIENIEDAQRYLKTNALESTLYNLPQGPINLTTYWGSGHETIFEEYLPGLEYSAEIIVSKGQLKSFFITRKFTSESPFFLELAHCTMPAIESEEYIAVFQQFQKILSALELHSTVAHLEFKMRGKQIILIEANIRPGGGEICEIWRLASGIDLLGAHLFGIDNEYLMPSSSAFKAHAVLHFTKLGSGLVQKDQLEQVAAASKKFGISCNTKLLKNLTESHSPIPTESGFRYARAILSSESFPNLIDMLEISQQNYLVQ